MKLGFENTNWLLTEFQKHCLMLILFLTVVWWRLTGLLRFILPYRAISFCDMFIRFIEAHGWFFGGGFKDITDERHED
ncbi:MAG: hypothetical protein ACOX4T_05145 [Acetivibrionales bacterium]